jgi:hypothetical protein
MGQGLARRIMHEAGQAGFARRCYLCTVRGVVIYEFWIASFSAAFTSFVIALLTINKFFRYQKLCVYLDHTHR